MILGENATVMTKRGVRLRFDPVRGRHVLLAPERVLFPCPTTVAILERIPAGGVPLCALIDELAAEYDAPREVIAQDVLELVSSLARGGMIRVEGEAPDVDVAA